jgi:hypothetical protein
MIGTGVGRFAASLADFLLGASTRVAKDTRILQGNPNYLIVEWEVTQSTLCHYFAFTQDGRYSYERYQIPSPGARRVVTGRQTGVYETIGYELTLRPSDGPESVATWQPAQIGTLLPGERALTIVMDGLEHTFYSRGAPGERL